MGAYTMAHLSSETSASSDKFRPVALHRGARIPQGFVRSRSFGHRQIVCGTATSRSVSHVHQAVAPIPDARVCPLLRMRQSSQAVGFMLSKLRSRGPLPPVGIRFRVSGARVCSADTYSVIPHRRLLIRR